MSIKNNYTALFYVFLFSHLVVWTVSPTISNVNLPLDTIEALAWGSNLSWGYSKHPPLSAFIVETVFSFFGNRDWAYYFLSQIFVILGFIYVWKFSNLIFKNKIYSLCSVLLIEGIYFYNYTSPEFNVNICQIPFWALTVYYSYKSLKFEKTSDFLLLGLFSALGFLSKYIFVYLIISIKVIFLIEYFKRKTFKIKLFLPGIVFLLIITPHLIWLAQNDFITLSYAFNRTGIENKDFITHLINPITFILKQLGILVPVIIMFLILIDFKKIRFSKSSKETNFLLLINIIPLILVFFTSLLSGANIRTMWMTPFYLFLGVFLIQVSKERFKRISLNKFYTAFILFFLLSPVTYIAVSVINEFKRTDYPGKEISNLVQRRWDRNFSNKISFVIGDEWYAGNLSYHLRSRPIWFNNIENNLSLINSDTGVIYTGNPKILKKFCPGIYGTIKPIGICMIGSK